MAQRGLSLRKNRKQEEAIAAFRRALQVSSISSKDQMQIRSIAFQRHWRPVDGIAEKRHGIEISRCESNL
jgi:hypothetical protein